MKKSLSRKTVTVEKAVKTSWKRRPSEMRGYQAALYTTTDAGDYLRVDFSLKDRKIRIYIEDAEEGGNPYYAVFVDGRITAQRNVTTGRAHQVVEKLKLRADSLRLISNREVRKSVINALGLDEPPPAEKPSQKQVHREALDRTRKRYFRPEENQVERTVTVRPVSMGSLFRGLLDYIAGLLLTSAVFIYFHSFIIAGVTAASFGLVIGLIELLIRGRDPSIIKLVFFMGTGTALYIYGYYFL